MDLSRSVFYYDLFTDQYSSPFSRKPKTALFCKSATVGSDHCGSLLLGILALVIDEPRLASSCRGLHN